MMQQNLAEKWQVVLKANAEKSNAKSHDCWSQSAALETKLHKLSVEIVFFLRQSQVQVQGIKEKKFNV